MIIAVRWHIFFGIRIIKKFTFLLLWSFDDKVKKKIPLIKSAGYPKPNFSSCPQLPPIPLYILTNVTRHPTAQSYPAPFRGPLLLAWNPKSDDVGL